MTELNNQQLAEQAEALKAQQDLELAKASQRIKELTAKKELVKVNLLKIRQEHKLESALS